MSVDRLLRVNELLKREIGESVFRVIHEEDFDPAAVTITRVITGKDLCNATVMVSVRGEQRRRDRTLFLLRRHRAEIQRRINTDLILKRTPRLCFSLDNSIENGDRVLAILSELGKPEDTDNPAPDTGAES